MAKLERLPWIDGFVLDGYGVRVGVRVNDADLLPALRSRLPPGVQSGENGVVDRMLSVLKAESTKTRGIKQYHLLYADHVVGGRSFDFGDVLEAYDSHVRVALAQYSRPNLFVHAGAVAWNGRAIILPAKTLSGKSHLVAELVRTGAVYFSDEYAILDAAGNAHPFPKPLSLREHRAARQRDVTADELDGIVGTEPLAVGLVVSCEYEAGAGWHPRRLSPGAGVLELLANAFGARERPGAALDILQRVVAQAPVLKCKRGDAIEVAGAILAAADDYSGASVNPTQHGANR